MELGRVGLWTFALELLPMSEAREAAAEIEELGYPSLWIPEAMGRESLTNAAMLLSSTEKLIIATGITNIWGRDAWSMAAAQKSLTEAFPARFLLGMGVSHAPLVGMRGHDYGRPLSAMRAYLEAMEAAPYAAPVPTTKTATVLAALAPKMLQLAAEKTLGSHPYFVPPEHTAFARETMGPNALLAPEQKVLLETDPTKARAIARKAMEMYLGLPNYVNNLKRLGYTDDDVRDGGSDRLVDAIVAWGDVDAILARVKAHHDAGADHVCVQVLAEDPRGVPREPWRELAPALLQA